MISRFSTYINEAVQQYKKSLVIGLVIIAISGVTIGILIGPYTPFDSEHETPDRPNVLLTYGGQAMVTEDGNINQIKVTVTKGRNVVDLSKLTILWAGPIESRSLVSGTESQMNAHDESVSAGSSQYYYVRTVYDEDNSSPTVNEESDRFEIVMNATAIRGKPLKPGQELNLKITTADQGIVPYSIQLPESTDGKSAVAI